jgi:hypothetical protein
MKDKLAILTFFFVFLHFTLSAQFDYKRTTISSISLGYGIFSPSENVISAFETKYNDDFGKYGGLFVDFKFLRRTDLIFSRLKLGGEIIMMIKIVDQHQLNGCIHIQSVL